MIEYMIREYEAGQRLDKYLAKRLREAPKSFLYRMLRKKNITLNKKKASGSEILKTDDMVQFFLSEETFRKFEGSAGTAWREAPLEIVYEDGNVLFINKPAGMLSQPDQKGDPSLPEYLTAFLLKKGEVTEEMLRTFRPAVCNRLDRNTSGLVAAGKTLLGLQELSRMFHDRRLRKYYLALVEGEVREEKEIRGYLGKDEMRNQVFVIPEQKENTVPIRTRYTPLCIKGGKTLLLVELITGKSHQIRAHLSSIGHPVLGDPKYGAAKGGKRHQLLHAWMLVFPEDTGKLPELSGRTVRAPLPDYFRKTLNELKIEENELLWEMTI